MKLATQEGLTSYLEDDWVERFLLSEDEDNHAKLTCVRWMQDSPAKRFIFSWLYKDFMNGFSGRVLDVGGGLTTFTPCFGRNFKYELLDLMHHDDQELVQSMVESVPEGSIKQLDWMEFKPEGTYDVVVANDLFPNVDQRLGEFLEKYLPVTREVRLSLTYYNHRRSYKVKRVDGDEIFFMRPWDGYRLAKELLPFEDRIIEPDLSLLERDQPSLFSNGRQVCVLTIKGGIENS
jgi:hypothetical protein